MSERLHHIGFGVADLGEPAPTLALLSGDPARAEAIATEYLRDPRALSHYRGLTSYVAHLPDGRPVLSATSGMGAPSLSIVVNELVQVGMRTIIRVGTSGSIQPHVKAGSIVISKAALCRQGAADDLAPPQYPASADPFVTVALVEAARELGVEAHLGVTASVDTFYEGQEREDSANPRMLRAIKGSTAEYRSLGILNFEMESGTLFKMGNVYGFAAGCVCAVLSERMEGEGFVQEAGAAIDRAIRVALAAAAKFA